MQHHMAANENAKCHTHVYVRTCVRVSVIKENFHYLISHTLFIYPLDFSYFRHVGLFSFVFMRK